MSVPLYNREPTQKYSIFIEFLKFIFQFDDLSRLRGCIRLQDVTLRGNPISRIAKYRDQVRALRTNHHPHLAQFA